LGIEFIQLPRFEQDGTAISATAVRTLITEGRWQETEKLVPDATWRYISEEENREKIIARINYAR
jgi:citrate lyase synthetase